MRLNSQLRSKVRSAAGALLLLTAAVGLSANPTAAQEDSTTTCISQTIDTHFWLSGPEQSEVFPVEIPATTISIPVASSRDFYAGRAPLSQPSEKWQLQFLDASGNVLAVSAPTEDVPDGEDDQSWSGPLPDVELTEPVSGIRAIHRPDLPADGQFMSVWASGITLCWPNQGAVPQPICPDDADGNMVAPDADGSCPTAPTCPDDADGNMVAPDADGSCPTAPTCPDDADGNIVLPAADGSCAPLGPTIPDCGSDAAGNPIAPLDDATCPIGSDIKPPDPLGPTTLPVTGVESTLLIGLAGLFMAAAGWALVLRPRRQAFGID